MKKVSLLLLAVLFGGMMMPHVQAESIYFQNDNGVVLTEEEYNYFGEMYWDGYQELLTQDTYDFYKNEGVIGKPIEKKSVVYNPYTRGSLLYEKGRTLTIGTSCNTNCTISLSNSWAGTPTITSYDVFGLRLTSATVRVIDSASIYGDNYSQVYTNPQTFSNGFGYSMKVPDTTNIKANITLSVTKSGTAYGSYQHAMSAISEANSKRYTIGDGYGRVFEFSGVAISTYDQMNGVDATLG